MFFNKETDTIFIMHFFYRETIKKEFKIIY